MRRVYTRECYSGSTGHMSRECRRRGSEGYWANVDTSACIRESLLAIESIFQQFKSGYSLPGNGSNQEKIVVTMFTLLSKETKVSQPPTKAEYSLILGLIQDCTKYLRDMDFSLDNWEELGGVGPHHYWKLQILGVIDEFYNVIRYMARQEEETDGQMQLLQLLMDTGILMAGDLEIGQSQFHNYCPAITYSARLPRGPQTVFLTNSLKTEASGYKQKEGQVTSRDAEDTPCSSILVASHTSIDFTGNRGMVEADSEPPEVFRTLVLSLAGLHLALRLPRSPQVIWRLASPILTVMVEKEVGGGDSMRLGDLAPEGLTLAIQFPLLVQTNLTFDRLHCSALDSGLHRPRLLPSPHCKLNLSDGGLAFCNCSATGTFALLLSREAEAHRSAIAWPSTTTLIYGTTAGLVLDLLALAALLRAHLILPSIPDSLLKLLSCGSLSIFFILLLVVADKMVPPQAEEVVQVVVLSSLLATLTANLALLLHASSTVIYICRPVFVHYAIAVISIGPPLLHLITLSSALLYSTTTLIQCLLYSSMSLPLLFLVMPLAVVALHRLRLHSLATLSDSPKNEELLAKVASLQYGLLNITLVVMINIFGALFITHKRDTLYELLLSFSCASTGLSLLCSFVLRSGCSATSGWLWSSHAHRHLSSSPASAEHSLGGATSGFGVGTSGGNSEGVEALEEEERANHRSPSCEVCSLRSGSPLRGKCLLQDERNPMIPGTEEGPETLLEVIERMKPGSGEEQSFPSSRRSTITGSSTTLMTSRDTSDYVTQEFPTVSQSPHGNLVSSSSFTSGELVGLHPLPSSSSLPTRPISPQRSLWVSPKSGRHACSSLPRRS